MPSPVENSLATLVPTLSPIPDELSNLATSLTAQSRTKAPNLKPEEEIGRIYACCHIACQRLGHRLALEIAKPAPPVKPKIYTKLHTYLNSVLKTTTTPRSARNARADPAQATTPTPRRNATTSVSQPRDGGRIVGRTDAESEVPLSTPTTNPTSRKRKAATVEDEPQDILGDKGNDEDETGEGAEAQEDSSDEDIIRTPRAKRLAKTPLRRQEKHGSTDEDDLGPAGLLPGLGTMFQPAIDWLSDEKREDYVRWKKAILREAALVG